MNSKPIYRVLVIAGKSGSRMGVADSVQSLAVHRIHSKVQDKKKLQEWSLYESVWFGRGWSMSSEFEAVRNKYPSIPVEKVDATSGGATMGASMGGRPGSSGVVLGERQLPKLFGFLNTNLYSVTVKADLKGKNVMKRTMLVIGRDVKQLEAAVERRNKFRSLPTGSSSSSSI